MALLYKLIRYSGVIAVVCLLTAAIFGVTGANFTGHKWSGLAAVGFGLIHGGLILYRSILIKRRRS